MEAACTIGIDVGGTKVLGVVVDGDHPGTPLASETLPTPEGAEHLLDVIAQLVSELTQEIGSRLLSGVGIGMPGLVNRNGILCVGPNLPGASDVDVSGVLRERVGVPVVVDNDGNCAAWGEVQAGAARGLQNVTFVGLGTGIAGGLVVDGRLIRGGHGFAGEPGHMTVVPHGLRCACGRLGCWEAYASGTGLARLASIAASEGRAPGLLARAGGDPAKIRGEEVTAALVAGNPEAEALVDEFAQWVAIGISNLVNVLDPEMVVLGGTMVEVGEALLRPVRRAYLEQALAPNLRNGPPLVAAALGRMAGGVGAALLPQSSSLGRG
jgi:glucokinase